MRTLACMTLTSLLLVACGDDGNMATTQSSKTADPSEATHDPSASSTQTPETGSSGASGISESADDTTGPTTNGPTTGGPTTVDPTTGDPTTGGVDEGLMGKYGHACATDDDCVAILGAGGICQKEILGVYNLPGGYCTTYCQLPDQQTTYLKPPNDCKLEADCVGLMGFFEACAYECTDNAQCPREGYECRQMPQISNPDDPKYCLMTEDNMIMP